MSVTPRPSRHLRQVVASTLLALAATAVLPVLGSAQPPARSENRGGGGGGGRMMAALFDGITLTDAERKSVDSIRATYQPQMEELRSQGPSSRPQMRSLMQKETGDFRALLTSDQQSVFDKNVAAMQARMENRQGGGQGGGGMGGGSRTNPQQS